ncbi:pentapeptide repeat-containing protein [Microbacterium pygmaeum]|uniref:pentapeptide repeat-containing protein n=1 Tax=Microbacterium pygmaeum TaxID=370764 RepID=UPI000B813D29
MTRSDLTRSDLTRSDLTRSDLTRSDLTRSAPSLLGEGADRVKWAGGRGLGARAGRSSAVAGWLHAHRSDRINRQTRHRRRSRAEGGRS